MKILMTGAAGFIASHVSDLYASQGHELVVVDNLSTGKLNYVNRQARFIEADITNKDLIQGIIKQEKPEVINHHAAHIQVGNSVRNPQFDAENNIIALLHIMEAAKESGVKKVIMASTGGAMYGNKPLPLTEEMKEEPVSPYGVSKRSGELYLNYYYQQYGIPYLALRYANVYGPRQNPHGESGVIAIFAEKIVKGEQPIINGDGSFTRDYVYVGDVARANLLALDSEFVGALNIGTQVQTSTNDVFDKVVAALGSTMTKQYGPVRAGDIEHGALSYQKAQQILGWKPEVTFDEGVRLVGEWYKSQQ